MMITPAAGLRRLHQRLIFREVRGGGALSRAQLAKRTGLSPPAVGKVVDDLLEGGLFEEQIEAGHPSGSYKIPSRARGTVSAPAPEGRATLGRPGRPVCLQRTIPRFVAIQLGLSRSWLAALPVAGPAGETGQVQFATPKRAATWLARLKAARKKVRIRQPWAVVISVPGFVDERASTVLFSPQLRWIEQTDLVNLVRQAWNAPVLLVSEVRALARGQAAVQPQPDEFVLVDLGQSIAAATVRQGELDDTASPFSGQIAHLPVPGNKRVCECGSIGCAQTLVSRGGLLSSFMAARQLDKKHRSRPSGSRSWPQLVKHLKQHGIESWMKESLDTASSVIANALNHSGLNHVFVTGWLIEMPGEVMEAFSAGVQRSALWSRFGQVHVEAVPPRPGAGLVAAAIDRLLLPAR